MFFLGADGKPHWCTGTSLQSTYRNLVAVPGVWKKVSKDEYKRYRGYSTYAFIADEFTRVPTASTSCGSSPTSDTDDDHRVGTSLSPYFDGELYDVYQQAAGHSSGSINAIRRGRATPV